MVEQTVDSDLVGAASYHDVVSNVVSSPAASRFVREILEKALTNPVGIAPRWLADTWALLANILMNDYLNSWNYANIGNVREAEDAVQNALALNADLALAHHAHGLVHRANGRHQAALDAFGRTVKADGKFARGHAQYGNQLVLLGRFGEALAHVQTAIGLGPHPAAGYFHWILGRAHFFMADYDKAIPCLCKSVKRLPTVWYNRLYLVSAYAKSGQMDDASSSFDEFNNIRQFYGYTLQRVESNERASPDNSDAVKSGREIFHEGLKMVEMPES